MTYDLIGDASNDSAHGIRRSPTSRSPHVGLGNLHRPAACRSRSRRTSASRPIRWTCRLCGPSTIRSPRSARRRAAVPRQRRLHILHRPGVDHRRRVDGAMSTPRRRALAVRSVASTEAAAGVTGSPATSLDVAYTEPVFRPSCRRRTWRCRACADRARRSRRSKRPARVQLPFDAHLPVHLARAATPRSSPVSSPASTPSSPRSSTPTTTESPRTICPATWPPRSQGQSDTCHTVVADTTLAIPGTSPAKLTVRHRSPQNSAAGRTRRPMAAGRGRSTPVPAVTRVVNVHHRGVGTYPMVPDSDSRACAARLPKTPELEDLLSSMAQINFDPELSLRSSSAPPRAFAQNHRQRHRRSAHPPRPHRHHRRRLDPPHPSPCEATG